MYCARCTYPFLIAVWPVPYCFFLETETKMFGFTFFFNSILIGVGLAMDAFSVSLANGLSEPKMSKKKTCVVAGTFALMQGIMPLIGWFFVHTMVGIFGVLEKFIPWIALALLSFIGAKMLSEGIRELRCRNAAQSEAEADACPVPKKLGIAALALQGIATSIDALSVGFTISEHGVLEAVVAALVIALVTFAICIAGIYLGKRFGTALAGKSAIFGGAILIFIGIEIFVTSFI